MTGSELGPDLMYIPNPLSQSYWDFGTISCVSSQAGYVFSRAISATSLTNSRLIVSFCFSSIYIYTIGIHYMILTNQTLTAIGVIQPTTHVPFSLQPILKAWILCLIPHWSYHLSSRFGVSFWGSQMLKLKPRKNIWVTFGCCKWYVVDR